jgi:diguanylate cyclase (GGDEF)-like protein
MIIPKIPANEEKRLETLHSLNILDTAAEERFDRITRIAKQIFNVPIALVSLVDANRQWFKSKQGFTASEIPRDISFCGHAILSDEIMVVEDASLDNRFHDNPLVLESPHIKFYLGCPLKINKQYNVGTLCLFDEKSRQFSIAERAVMRDLADMVQAELEAMHMATTDELTGLTNRRGFLSMGNHVFNLCQRNNTNMILLFFDLNKFKYINDTFGHKAGDQVLHIFAELLLTNFRNSDVIARLGGDEFCVLCSELPEENINLLLERFNHVLKTEVKTEYPINYSVGHIVYDKDKHKSLSEMLDEADQQMYLDKQKRSKDK